MLEFLFAHFVHPVLSNYPFFFWGGMSLEHKTNES